MPSKKPKPAKVSIAPRSGVVVWGIVARPIGLGMDCVYLPHVRSTRRLALESARSKKWTCKYRAVPLILADPSLYKVVPITPTKPTKVKAPEAVKCWAGITQTGRVQRWESENDGNRHLAIYPTRRDARSDWTMVVPGVFTPTKPTRRKT